MPHMHCDNDNARLSSRAGTAQTVNTAPHHHSRLRRQYAGEIKALDKRHGSAEGLAIFSLHAALIAILPYIYFSQMSDKGIWFALSLPFVMFFIATRFKALGNILHECSHNIYFRSRRANKILGTLIANIEFTGYAEYTDEHLTHHRHLGDAVKDKDLGAKSGFGFHEKLTLGKAMKHLVYPLSLLHIATYSKFKIHFLRPYNAESLLRLSYFCMLVFLTALYPLYMALFIIVPYFVLYPILHYWTDAIDHAGLIPREDELYGSRNFLLPSAALRWILFPRNDCYHLVHHLFPAVASPAFPALHKVLLEDEAYGSLNHSVTDKLRALWRDRAERAPAAP